MDIRTFDHPAATEATVPLRKPPFPLCSPRSVGGRGVAPPVETATVCAAPPVQGTATRSVAPDLRGERHLAQVIPHAKLVTYPDAAHGFFFQEAADFVPRLTAFLR